MENGLGTMKARHVLNKLMGCAGCEIVRSSKRRGIDWRQDLKTLFFEDIYLFLKNANYRFSGLYDLSYQSGECPRWGDALFLA